MTDPIRIIVVDDHPLFRRGVVDSLSAEEDFVVVDEAATGEEAADKVVELVPDILLLDIDMPGEGGIAAAGRITAMSPTTRILMLTVSESEDHLLRALKAGAMGYVIKGVSAHGLAHAVRALMAGEVYVSPTLASTILYEMTHDEPADALTGLTERERQVLELIGEGLTNREIGERLFLAEKTIKHYVTGVLRKLQVRSRVEAALLARDSRQAEARSQPPPQ